MTERQQGTADEVLAIRMEDGAWYAIPRDVVERSRVSEEVAERLQKELDGSEVEAYSMGRPDTSGIPHHGIALTIPTMIVGPYGAPFSQPDPHEFEGKLPTDYR
jgi:hypothetical protein